MESERAFKFCPECGAEPVAAAPSREQRKTVTVLFCDLAGSTALGEALDPERLRALLARYLERMKTIAEQHGRLARALDYYGRKGNLAAAQRAQERFARVRDEALR